MAVVQTTVQELKVYVQEAKSLQMLTYRAEIDYARRMILNLQRELTRLKSEELLVMQTQNVITRKETLEDTYSADVAQKTMPGQVISPSDTFHEDIPPQTNNSDRHLKARLESCMNTKMEVADAILKTNRMILVYQQRITDYEKKITDLGPEYTIFSAKHNILKRSYSELYMLMDVHLAYKKLKTSVKGTGTALTVTSTAGGTTTTSTVYYDTPKEQKEYVKLAQLFETYASRNSYCNPQNGEEKKLVLDFSDPGSDMNGKAIEAQLAEIRGLMTTDAQTKFDTALKKHSDRVLRDTTDPQLSKYINNQPQRKAIALPEDAISSVTQNLSAAIKFTNEALGKADKVVVTWTSDKITSAKNWFKKQVGSYYPGVPFCKDSSAALSTEELYLKNQSQASNKSEASAAAEIQRQLATLPTISEKDIDSSYQNLFTEVKTAANTVPPDMTPATSELIVEKVTYLAFNVQGVRILNADRVALDYIMEMRYVLGYLSEQTYLKYIADMQSYLGGLTKYLKTK